MLPPINTQKLTVKAAADLIAMRVHAHRPREKRAVAAPSPPPAPSTPEAAASPSRPGNIAPWTAALAAGGLGAGAGLLGSLSDERKRRRWLRNTLLGGALGAASGGAGATLWNNIGAYGQQNPVEQARTDLMKSREEAAAKAQAAAASATAPAFDPVRTFAKYLWNNTVNNQIPLTPEQLELADQAKLSPDDPLRQPIASPSTAPSPPLATMGTGAAIGAGLGGARPVASRLDKLRAGLATPADVNAINVSELKKQNPALAKHVEAAQKIFTSHGLPKPLPPDATGRINFRFPDGVAGNPTPHSWRAMQDATVPKRGLTSSRSLGRIGGGVAGATAPLLIEALMRAAPTVMQDARRRPY